MPYLTKTKWDYDGIQCKACGYLHQRNLKECPKCKHKRSSDPIIERLKNE